MRKLYSFHRIACNLISIHILALSYNGFSDVNNSAMPAFPVDILNKIPITEIELRIRNTCRIYNIQP